MGIILGHTDAVGYGQAVTLADDDRHHHVYAIGQTGTGKSSFLRNALVQDLEAGRGVGLLDPHGDLAEAVLDLIPPWRTNAAIYFNPADQDYPIGLNPLALTDPAQRHRVILNTVAALRGLWSDIWGLGRMQYILTHTLAALLDYEHATLLGVNRLLADERFRAKVLARVRDPVVQGFWRDEFGRYDGRLRAEAVAPIQNKVGQFGALPLLRHILGQVRPAIDFRRVLDEGQVFIANLAKGRLGEDASRLLGAFLVAQFQLAALGRADVAASARRPFYLYLDEFQSFAAVESLAAILSEARKYGLALTLAHQYLGQLTPAVQAAVFGNVGTVVCFRVGFEDAPLLAAQLEPVAAASLTELDPHRAWVRRLCGGATREPALVTLEPPYAPRAGRAAIVAQESRRKYGRPRAEVEANIATWLAH